MHFCLRAPTPRLQFLEREKLSQVYCGKKEDFSRTLVRIESFFKSHLTAVMRGFLFPLSCVDRLLFHSGHVSKVAGRCHKERLGLRVARAFTSKLQEALLATGRKWIKNHCSKLRRWIRMSCGSRPNDNSVSVSSFQAGLRLIKRYCWNTILLLINSWFHCFPLVAVDKEKFVQNYEGE